MSASVPSSSVSAAAIWLSELVASPSPIVPALCSRFALSATDACEAIRIASELRSERSELERLRNHAATAISDLEAGGATILTCEADGPSLVVTYHPAGAAADTEIRQTFVLRQEATRRMREWMDEEIPVELDDEARRLRDLH